MLEPQPTAVVRGHVEQQDLPAFLGAAFGETVAAITAQRHAPAGPPFARYRMSEAGFDVEAGFPSTGPVTAAGASSPANSRAERRPRSSTAATTPGSARPTRRRERGWPRSSTRRTAIRGRAYLDEPGVAEPRTVVHVPYRAA